MNVRDPFNIRTGSLNRPPIATWKSSSSNRNSYNTHNNLSPLHHIIRTAATATQSAAADLREKAGEVVQSAQRVLAEAATAAATTLDIDVDLESQLPDGDNDDAAIAQQQHYQQHDTPRDNNHNTQKAATTPKKKRPLKKDMSFSVPKNVPSFSNPQRRQHEDRLWAAATNSSSSSSSSRQRPTAALGGVHGLFSPKNGNGLPMYKDKPYMYPPGAGPRPLYRRKRGACGLLVLVLVVLAWWAGLFAGGESREQAVARLNKWGWIKQLQQEGDDGVGGGGRGKAVKKKDWLERRQRVVEAMELSWDAYERYAWGRFFSVLRGGVGGLGVRGVKG
jgi:mannosyl-oligosaccharide alpha-1,2-mannosidase